VYFKETSNSSLLLRANDIIQSFTHVSKGLSRFNPQWILIATWYNVGYFSTHTDLVNYPVYHFILFNEDMYENLGTTGIEMI